MLREGGSVNVYFVYIYVCPISSVSQEELSFFVAGKKGKVLPRTGHEGPEGE
jgi:hypothetical protein